MSSQPTIRTFIVLIVGWGAPLRINAYDKNDAEILTRVLFKVPTSKRVLILDEIKKEGI